MRPKSIATVVVDLPSTRVRSSVSTLISVMPASVVSGVISLTAPTKVVLPTPNPPATTILTGVGACFADRDRAVRRLEVAESIQHPLQQREVGTGVRARGAMDLHHALSGQVSDEDTGDPEGHVEMG